MVLPHDTNRNWRGNPSLLIRFVHPLTSTNEHPHVSNLQIDICKTFLSSTLRWFPKYGVRTLDGVLITHDHADAVLGMDDIRSLQRYDVDPSTGLPITPSRLKVHVSNTTFQALKTKFHYLIDEQPSGPNAVERKVAQIEWPRMYPFVPFRLEGLEILPLPVLHGEDYVSFGFLFGTGLGKNAERETCLYISDVSRIPQVTYDYLCTGRLPTPPLSLAHASGSNALTHPPDSSSSKNAFFEQFNSPSRHQPLPRSTRSSIMPDEPHGPIPSIAPKIHLLIVDALFPDRQHNTHFSLEEAIQCIERLQPKKAYITGMSDLFEYHRHNHELKERKAKGTITVDIQLAYDGLRIPIRI